MAQISICGVLGSVVNLLVVKLLSSISNETIPLWVGILLISDVSCYIVATLGIEQVLKVGITSSILFLPYILMYIATECQLQREALYAYKTQH